MCDIHGNGRSKGGAYGRRVYVQFRKRGTWVYEKGSERDQVRGIQWLLGLRTMAEHLKSMGAEQQERTMEETERVSVSVRRCIIPSLCSDLGPD